MLEVTLSIDSPQGTTDVPLKEDSLTIGRTDAAHFVVSGDTGLSRRHATIRRERGRVIIFDEHSTNGSFVNGAAVAPEGQTLSDGDVISIGNNTTIRVRLSERAQTSPPPVAAQASAPPASSPAPHATGNSLPLKFLLPLVAVVVLLVGGVGFGLYRLTRDKHTQPTDDNTAATNQTGVAPADSADDPTTTDGDESPTSPTFDASPASPSSNDATTTPGATSSVSDPLLSPSSSSAPASDSPLARTDFDTSPVELVTAPTQGAVKLYQKMNDAEKREFIKQRAQKVALMMGNRPYAFSPDALDEIKFWLDAFARRIGNNQTGLWRGDTRNIFERARANAPVIIQAFKQSRVPPVIGLYIPFIETEYTNISTNNVAGAAGLFQFLGPTAEGYGVPASERTNIARMAPAAAKYFRDNIMRFGNDSMSVALSIAGYNRNPESVMRDLRNVLNEQDNAAKERTFWTLIANKGKLDQAFQNENKNYVPRFFAAAIMGETPWAFGLDMRPLSTYTQPDNQTQPRTN